MKTQTIERANQLLEQINSAKESIRQIKNIGQIKEVWKLHPNSLIVVQIVSNDIPGFQSQTLNPAFIDLDEIITNYVECATTHLNHLETELADLTD